ncbi:Cyclin_N domain-containing protein [Cephalotus follicularis]|uniref:B-like cyclin n=1 Tax=Cephalotus follicularis TaxID=3775 RepID=A0A1Q3DI83_CEPFO|nr:Cyclin_N domain-containing protein [Cephalotus follicularis]
MLLSCSDLLCGEDSGIFSGVQSTECSSDLESPSFADESIAGFIEDERHFVPGVDYLARFESHSLDASAREESVAWILKVQAYYNFQPLTAYLSVNYLDRFLYSHRLPVSFR